MRIQLCRNHVFRVVVGRVTLHVVGRARQIDVELGKFPAVASVAPFNIEVIIIYICMHVHIRIRASSSIHIDTWIRIPIPRAPLQMPATTTGHASVRRAAAVGFYLPYASIRALLPTCSWGAYADTAHTGILARSLQNPYQPSVTRTERRAANSQR